MVKVTTLSIVLLLLLNSCAIRPRAMVVKEKGEYPAIAGDSVFVFYNRPQQIPIEYGKIGNVNYIDYNSWRVDSIEIFSAVMKKAKSIGGNAILIKEYRNFAWSSEYFKGDVLRVSDFNSPPDLLYTKVSKYEIYGKGTCDLRISIPEFNHFLMKPKNEGYFTNFGCLGLLLGVDFYHTNNQYLNLSISVGMNFIAPVPVPFDIFGGEYDFCDYYSASISNNHRSRHFAVGYGLNFSHYQWQHALYDNGQIIYAKTYSNNAIGFILSSYWIPKNNFSIGLIYRPSFIAFSTKPLLKYEHLVSVDFAWKIRLRTK